MAALLRQRRWCPHVIDRGQEDEGPGLQEGLSDLFFYEPRGEHHGLAIELKRDKGRATPDQKLWKEELQRRGYKAVIAMGYSACLDAIKDYFNEDNLSL